MRKALSSQQNFVVTCQCKKFLTQLHDYNDECVFTELSCDCPIQQQASDDCVFHQLDQTQHHLTHNPSTHQQSHHHRPTSD